MKKLTLVVAMVLLVAGLVFAADPVTATLTGSATATWGVDLQNQATGFQNSASVSIEVPLIAEASEEKTGDVPYGYIKLEDFEVTIDDSDGLTVTAPSVTAKLVLSDALSVTLYGAPSFAVGQASPFLTIADVAADNDDPALADSVDPDLSGYTGGLTLTYAMDMATIAFKVASHGDWDVVNGSDAEYGWVDADDDPSTAPTWGVTTAATTGTPANTANDYSAGVDLTVAPVDMVTLNFKAGYGPFSASDVALSSMLTLKPVDMLSLWAALDGSLPNGGSFAYDAGFGVNVATDVVGVDVAGYYGADDLEVQTVLTLNAVENLSFTETFEVYTVLTSLDFASKTAASYSLDSGVKPYANVTYYNNGSAAGTLQLQLGVEVTKVMANTTFKVDWTSGSDISSDIGDVEVSATVTY